MNRRSLDVCNYNTSQAPYHLATRAYLVLGRIKLKTKSNTRLINIAHAGSRKEVDRACTTLGGVLTLLRSWGLRDVGKLSWITLLI